MFHEIIYYAAGKEKAPQLRGRALWGSFLGATGAIFESWAGLALDSPKAFAWGDTSRSPAVEPAIAIITTVVSECGVHVFTRIWGCALYKDTSIGHPGGETARLAEFGHIWDRNFHVCASTRSLWIVSGQRMLTRSKD